ncbi:hypothetical protein AUJ13_05910 [Candidatus Micrarchaeota archaeon CG1_02_49_24]|nr:MAG: hypothetical protein AUJ13_05910 [Candidatus Micrarchaeota archaeon CG1_02_49_24]
MTSGGVDMEMFDPGGNGGKRGFQKKEQERDTRRIFSATQKKQLLYQQNSKCGLCHKKLDPREIEYDHKKPWAARG